FGFLSNYMLYIVGNIRSHFGKLVYEYKRLQKDKIYSREFWVILLPILRKCQHSCMT
ncbi:hypothetical protein L9F63_000846, partial [Diploptera punctata]